MRELKLQPENIIVDIPELNQFRIGDKVIADECADCDRHEGFIIGIELQRLHGSNYLSPSITLLHDGYVTDGFKPMHLRKAEAPAPQAKLMGAELLTTIKQFARLHHLNEMTIAAGKTPSDSEIDFEATAWNRINRAIAVSEGSASV